MTIVTNLRGFSDEQIKQIFNYYSHGEYNDHYDKVVKMCNYKEDEIRNFYDELQIVTERYMNKCNIRNYPRLSTAFIQYLYDKYFAPAPMAWNPRAKIIVNGTEFEALDVKITLDRPAPTLSEAWNMTYNDE